MTATEPTSNIQKEAAGRVGRDGAKWPDGHQFALFLSHDVDNLYDRELFRFLGNLNYLRRVWMAQGRGSAVGCARRLMRTIVRPRIPGDDIRTILSIEREHGFRSTFFLLEDPTFGRYGGRYRYTDSAVKDLAREIHAAGCELAVHGAYHAFNDAEKYREQKISFEKALNVRPAGIRNHYLRHDGLDTWRAQFEAGFSYDASFGFIDHVGVRDGHYRPFFVFGDQGGPAAEFVALPLTIMDSVVFRRLRLNFAEALDLCKKVALDVESWGGLLSVLWHNDCFDEPGFRDWQAVYVDFLGWLAAKHPWNATGEEVAAWWRTRSSE